MKEVLETWFEPNRYSHRLLVDHGGGNEGGEEDRFGSKALTITYASRQAECSQSGITLLGSTNEDSRSMKQTLKLFEPLQTPQQAVSYLQNLSRSGKWTLDLSNYELSSRIPIQPGSVVDTVIRYSSLDSPLLEEVIPNSSFELRYPKTLNIDRYCTEAGQKFSGLNSVYLRLRRNGPNVFLAEPFQSVSIKITTSGSTGGGKVSLGRDAGVRGAREIDLKLEDVRLRDINEILSEIRYIPTRMRERSIEGSEENVVEVLIEADGEVLKGKVVVNLL